MSSGSLYELNTKGLERFIADHIQADSQFLGCCGDVINTLVTYLQNEQSVPKQIRPRRIIKSGSLGKGTALKHRSDIDLVLMLCEYDDVDDLMRNMRDLLKQLKGYILRHPGARHQKTTRYSVQVEVTCRSGHTHDVDILPAVDLLGEFSPKAIYQKMRVVSAATIHEYSAVIIHEYSVSLAPLQLEIIGHLPTKVKNLIKLVKYWKNTKLKDEGDAEMSSFAEKRPDKPNWPSSYPLELVVVNAWSEVGKPIDFDMTRALHAVLTSLVNHMQFRIVLNGCMKYTSDMIRAPTSGPYIMDPANPYNDMYHGLVGGEAYDWERVVPKARTWLGKPLFDGVSNTKKSW